MPLRYPHIILAAMLPVMGAWSTQQPYGQTADEGPASHVAGDVLNQLPIPIRKFIESRNRGDPAGVTKCFTADAVLNDFGRRFEGRAGIAAWDKSDNTGVKAHLEVTSIKQSKDKYDVGVTVSGGGYNGSGHMHFILRRSRIARLEIQ